MAADRVRKEIYWSSLSGLSPETHMEALRVSVSVGRRHVPTDSIAAPSLDLQHWFGLGLAVGLSGQGWGLAWLSKIKPTSLVVASNDAHKWAEKSKLCQLASPSSSHNTEA